jgi:hypothetical protein
MLGASWSLLSILTTEMTMNTKTCAACDCPLDASAISVTIGGKTVEVCCDECAIALKEARRSIEKGA